MNQNKLNKRQAEYLSAIDCGTNPSTRRLRRGFSPLLKRGLIEERTPLSDICDGFRLTKKGNEVLRGVKIQSR